MSRKTEPLRRKPSGLLTLGGIDFGTGKKYGPLPGTDTEAQLCRDLFRKAFPKERADRLAGHDAITEKVQKACDAGYRYLHLATHAYFEPAEQAERRLKAMNARNRDSLFALQERALVRELPFLRSWLVLADANQPPAHEYGRPTGVLLAEEVKGLDLRGCELVVLSACQTAEGDISRTDGVLGLQRAFHAAGARSVAASLWSVSDPATALLMEEFYTNLWTKKQSKLEALRQAQLTVLHHPERVQQKRDELLAALKKQGVGEETRRGIKGRFATELLDGGTVGPDKERRRSPVAWWAAFILSGDPSK
jgi:CHAT domain-containing protein